MPLGFCWPGPRSTGPAPPCLQARRYTANLYRPNVIFYHTLKGRYTSLHTPPLWSRLLGAAGSVIVLCLSRHVRTYMCRMYMCARVHVRGRQAGRGWVPMQVVQRQVEGRVLIRKFGHLWCMPTLAIGQAHGQVFISLTPLKK